MRVNFDRWIAHTRWREKRKEISKVSKKKQHGSRKTIDLDRIHELVENETFNAEIERLKQLCVCSYCLEDAETFLAQSKESSEYSRVGIPGFSYSILRFLSSRREELSRRYGDVTMKSMWHNEAKPRCSFTWWLNSKWGRQKSEIWLNRSSLQSTERLIQSKRKHGLIGSEEFTRLHNLHDDLNLQDCTDKDTSKYLLTRQVNANIGLLAISNEHAASIMQNLLNLGHVIEVRDANRSFSGTSLYRFVDRSGASTMEQAETVHLIGDSFPPVCEVFGQPIVACLSDVLLRRCYVNQFIQQIQDINNSKGALVYSLSTMYVVFEREAREFQSSFLFFMFMLCPSNYKNITRIAHSCRARKSLENQHSNTGT